MPGLDLMSMVASVQRSLGAQAEVTVVNGEIVDELNRAHKQLCGGFQWPFLYSEYLIPIKGTYNTGKVVMTAGSNVVNGIGTTWDPTWTYKRLLIGNLDWPVASFVSPTQLTIVQPANLNYLTPTGYTLYQDTYPMPLDFEPGADLTIVNQTVRLFIRHIPTLTLEKQNVVLKTMFTTFPTGYCDIGFDNGRHLIKIAPPPAQDDEWRLRYRRRPASLGAVTDLVEVPETWAPAVEFAALAALRMRHGLPGAQEADAMAVQYRKNMIKQSTSAVIDNMPRSHGLVTDQSSIQDGLFSILPGFRP